MNIYRGSQFQRGYGVGATLRNFFSWLMPIVQKHALPTLKEVGQIAVDTASNITKDVINGKNFKESSNIHINNSVDQIKNKLKGGKIKKNKKEKKKISNIK